MELSETKPYDSLFATVSSGERVSKFNTLGERDVINSLSNYKINVLGTTLIPFIYRPPWQLDEDLLYSIKDVVMLSRLFENCVEHSFGHAQSVENEKKKSFWRQWQ